MFQQQSFLRAGAAGAGCRHAFSTDRRQCISRSTPCFVLVPQWGFRRALAVGKPSLVSRSARDVLGVGPRCTEIQVKEAYRREAKRLHPDSHQGANKETASRQFQELQESYRSLLDELRGKGPAVGSRQHQSSSSSYGPGYSTEQWARQAAQQAKARDSEPDAPDLSVLVRSTVGLLLLVLAYNAYSNECERQMEEEDQATFSAKRALIQKENAEYRQRELQSHLAKQAARR